MVGPIIEHPELCLRKADALYLDLGSRVRKRLAGILAQRGPLNIERSALNDFSSAHDKVRPIEPSRQHSQSHSDGCAFGGVNYSPLCGA